MFACWTENPCPVAEKFAVTPPTVRFMGRGVPVVAELKSNKTDWADAPPPSEKPTITATKVLNERTLVVLC